MPRVSAEHRAARRDQILAAAVACVAREGFHKTTMAHVIAESGLSAGAVYGYFKGKNEIIRAIADLAVGSLAASLEEVAAGPDPVHPADALRVVLDHVERLAGRPEGDLSRVAVQAWAEACRDEQVRGIAAQRMLEVRTAWRAVLTRARDDGRLDPGVDLEAATAVMLGQVPGFVLQRLVVGDVDAASYAAGLRALMR